MEHSARRGFTLIEILVVITIIAAIISIAVPIYTSVQDTKNVTLCKSNLRSIGNAIQLYHNRFRSYPRTSSGLQFLLEPLKTKIVDLNEKTIRNMYVCPGDDDAASAVGPGVVEAYQDLENIDPAAVSYAGRNTKDYPLRRKNAGAEVIACDAGGPDGRVFIHRDKINVLYLDQSVQDIDVVKLPNADPAAFEVGPNSPLEALRKLNKEP